MPPARARYLTDGRKACRTVSEATLHISELAARTGIRPQTLRDYEGRGLLGAVARGRARYREYDDRHVTRVHAIANARALGFSLDEIRTLLTLADAGGPTGARGVTTLRAINMAVLQRIDRLAALAYAISELGTSGEPGTRPRRADVLRALVGDPEFIRIAWARRSRGAWG